MASRPKDAVSRSILLAFGAVIVALTLLIAWIGHEARRDEAAASQDVRNLQTGRTIGQLRSCLGEELRIHAGREPHWRGSANEGGGLRAFNAMTDIGVRLYELGGVRKVVVSTRHARPLRPAELNAIDGCVG